jgi:photosystem II stability/assembly factor-like uncharacterized protein
MLVLVAAGVAATEPAAGPYACGATSKDYVVGAALPPSGLFQSLGAGEWRQLGFNHPAINAAAADPREPGVLYLAAGNGCIRATAGGGQWRILTDWRMTELQDVALDGRTTPAALYVALPDGIGYSGDGGRTWEHRDQGLARKFTQTIAVDRTRAGRVIAGTEQGLYLTGDHGRRWAAVGAPGLMMTEVKQSGADPRVWMATAQSGGLWRSGDGGATWSAVPRWAGTTLYDVSLDPRDSGKALVAGWSVGVWFTSDGGATWVERTAGLPSPRVWRVSFDARVPERWWASVHEEAVYGTDDAGRTWRRQGLPGTIIRDFFFAPEGPSR